MYCKYRSKGCKWQGTLREVDKHYLAKFTCEWCKKQLQCYEDEQHQQVCTMAVEAIECELKPFGCSIKLPRMSMHQHMQYYCKEHIELMKKAYKDSSSKVSLLTDKINLLEIEGLQFHTEKETELKEVRASCSLLTKTIDLLKQECVQKETELEEVNASCSLLTKKVDLLEKERVQFYEEKVVEFKEMRAQYSLLEGRLQSEKDATKERNLAIWQILQASDMEPCDPERLDDQLLMDILVSKEKKHQTLRTRFDQVTTEVNIMSEKVQSLHVQSQRYKYALGLSIILGLLIGIFLQYLYPVIFVKFILPVLILSILFLGICACYVCLSSC